MEEEAGCSEEGVGGARGGSVTKDGVFTSACPILLSSFLLLCVGEWRNWGISRSKILSWDFRPLVLFWSLLLLRYPFCPAWAVVWPGVACIVLGGALEIRMLEACFQRCGNITSASIVAEESKNRARMI